MLVDWLERLRDAFLASDEGSSFARVRGEREAGWDLVKMAECGWDLFGITPATMTTAILEHILVAYFPENVTFREDWEAGQVVPELRAFWQWAGRTHGLDGTGEMLARLDELEADLPGRINDPALFGPEKAFLTEGFRAGYDMTDPAQCDAFSETYDEWLPGQRTGAPPPPGVATKRQAAKAKQKRKMQTASRKRNRRK